MKVFRLTGLILLMGILLSSCGLVHQSRQIERFTQSKFTINSLTLESIMGKDVSHIKKTSDLRFQDLIAFTEGMLDNNLPAKVRFNIEVSNSSDKEAAISGMDWKLFREGDTLAYGQLNKSVIVAPHGKTSFDLEAQVKLNKIFQLKHVSQIFEALSGKVDAQRIKEMGFVIKLRPYYKLNGKIQKFPGYLTIHPNVDN